MKIKLKNIFNEKNICKEENKLDEEKMTDGKKGHRRKGAYIEEKEIKVKKYFDNLFRNKNHLSKGYYILLFCMLILGSLSVAITFKAYNLFAKEDYELYASSDIDEKEIVSTMSETEVPEKVDEKKETNVNAADAKVNVSKSKTSNVKQNTTVKALSFSKPLDGGIQKLYSIDKVIYSKTLELWKTHDGIDISAKIGTNVKAIEIGKVEKVYEDSFYGVTVVIDHGQGYKSSYSNLDKNTNVKEKQTVNKGQVIGKVSNTAIGEIKDDPHLHFTLFKDNNNVDPTYIFK